MINSMKEKFLRPSMNFSFPSGHGKIPTLYEFLIQGISHSGNFSFREFLIQEFPDSGNFSFRGFLIQGISPSLYEFPE